MLRAILTVETTTLKEQNNNFVKLNRASCQKSIHFYQSTSNPSSVTARAAEDNRTTAPSRIQAPNSQSQHRTSAKKAHHILPVAGSPTGERADLLRLFLALDVIGSAM